MHAKRPFYAAVNGLFRKLLNLASEEVILDSGYIWNKTKIKLKQNNFVSVLFQTWLLTCEIKQKQNTETILKRFRIVLELFQAH